MRRFSIGDDVRVSAKFLRSIDPAASKGWPTRYDPGKGTVVSVMPCGDFDLIQVWFHDLCHPKTYNAVNLVHERNVYNEAMRAEHRNPE